MKSPFIGGSNVTRSKNLADNRLVNLYVELAGDGAEDVGALFGTPGLVQILQSGNGPIRGFLSYFNVTLFFVSGNTLYFTDFLANTPQSIGTIAGSGLVSMVANLEQKVFITTDTLGYIYDLSNSTLTLVSLPPIGGPVDFIDSYFVFSEDGTAFFYIYDGVSFDPADVATAEAMPDHLVAVLADHSELWLFGQLHAEVWQDTGAADFPFERMPGGLIQQGCAAKFTPKRLDNSIYWLGRNEYGHGVVWRANGYTPARASTPAVEFAIQGYDVISDAFAMVYQQEGHSFYALTFPTANATWVLDVSNGLWHERTSYDSSILGTAEWRPNCVTFFQGQLIAGDSRTGKIFELSLDSYTDGDYGPVISLGPATHSTNAATSLKLAGTIVGSTTGFLRTEILTLVGGTYTRPAKVMVATDTADGTDVVTSVAIVDAGDYSEAPVNPVFTTGGSGATLELIAYWTTDSVVEIAPESGAGYAPTAPTIAIDSTYGSGALATCGSQVIATRPIAGLNYAVGDLLTLSGGAAGITAKVKVLAVDGFGAPLAFEIVVTGSYATTPTTITPLTGGSGNDGSLTAEWGLGAVLLTARGTEFSQIPEVTVSGSGEGASQIATVDFTTNYIEAIRSFRAIPQGVNNYKRSFHHSLQLYAQSGVGLNDGQGSDPLIGLDWSDDGGHTWSNQHFRKLGKIGESGHRVIWRRLGSTEKLRDRVYRIKITDPVKRAFFGAEIDIVQGAS